jgi:hypothetical protein
MKIMRLIFAFLSVLLLTTHSKAQVSEERAVLEVIKSVWLGMEKGDSALVHLSFTDDVTLATIFRSKAEGPVLKREKLNDFLIAVGTPHEPWFEETWNYQIEINADLATVWCEYAFYLGNTLSHCGADAFHLHKTEDGWKIFHLADTRQRLGCVVPDDIQKKHK